MELKEKVMSQQEIRQEAKRLRREADSIEYFASTLHAEHQQSAAAELRMKAKDLRQLQKEYEILIEPVPDVKSDEYILCGKGEWLCGRRGFAKLEFK